MGDNGDMNPDDERPVDLTDDDLEILPDQTSDDLDGGWGDWRSDDSNDDRLREDVPPHW
ncbi:hypothetical protein GCM10010468_38310 [Actinocorallia longicatena]|uniref:Uncharacterized protein n=2 Tax=Actinocorallia longicatena TaxID=111803 RepID=A0ABP6QGV9_9ACTN